MNEFNTKLLDLIVCPKTGSELTYDKKRNILVSKNKKYTYQIKDGLPILLINE
ncbi:MAG: hypothetical protein CMN00_03820 [Rickettsiales bacterium]|nr:hypothetical protein [Rickettsiales bacterium]|tara:strand:+ start:460 stop:618 length:159 start_codon:yes stop_codon:yes gene_type:complete